MNDQEQITAAPSAKFDYVWMAAAIAITAVATFVRFFWLELKPLHHDEGVNGHFLTTLFRSGEYRYDPENYHGPDLYYISLAFTKLFGLNTLSVRWSVAIFGVLTVVLVFWLRRYIGRSGALIAALLLSLSPGMTFISRYFIHEILFVFFSLAIPVAVLLFIERKKAGIGAIFWMTLILLVSFLPSALNLADRLSGESAALLWTLRVVFFAVESVLVYLIVKMLLGWNDGRPIYLLLASAATVMLFATKETGFITIGTMLIACVCLVVWRRLETVIAGRRLIFASLMTVLLGLVALVERARLARIYEDVQLSFTGATEPQTNLFYIIAAMTVFAILTWLGFIALSREDTSSAIVADDELNWRNYQLATGAADNVGLIAAKSLVLGVSIALVWAFVRLALKLFTGGDAKAAAAAKSAKAATFNFSNVDLTILAFAVVLIVVGLILRRSKNGSRISADALFLMITAVAVFLYLGALFFSSFFTYPEGLSKAFEAYAIWTKTGTKDHTQNGFPAYVRWGFIIESPLLILSALGTTIAFYKSRHRWAMFSGLWALGLFLAYTIIPYKTPWLALSFLLPMAIIAGYGVNELLTAKQIPLRIAAIILTITATGILSFQTYDLNFVRFDDDRMPYVYAHTLRDFEKLIDKMKYYADKSGKGFDTKIEIVSPDYWPMPWYMNDYPETIFQGKIVDANGAEMIVAKKGDQDPDIISMYGLRYRFAGEYRLRPGVELVLLVRNDIADADTRNIYDEFGSPLEIR